MRKLLVTSALPYANGHIHLGHLVEYIQTDIWVRVQRLLGNECLYICASDTHGTPIMLNAKKEGITPEQLVEKFRQEHQDDFAAFNIQFSYYGSTHSESNRVLSEAIFECAKQAGAIVTRQVAQLYSETDKMFLPDRFVKGTCPSCQAKDQYGDTCEVCSSTYSPMDLIEPYSVISGDRPVVKKSEHYFFQVSKFESGIKDWLETGVVQEDVKKKLQEWFDAGLKDWDISRDEPYFGFKIPGTSAKYFYVWLDAPVGYISATLDCVKATEKLEEIWRSGAYEIHHFIGKDIVYFHTLFWPAMLQASKYQLPSKINVHGFLTVNGEKMSKSRGTFILAKSYLKHLNPEFLRYYYAAKLSGTRDDLDLNLDDFMLRVNSDVLGKFINIASRLGSVLNKKCGGRMTTCDPDGKSLIQAIQDAKSEIFEDYEALGYSKAMRGIMGLADRVNQYIDAKAPWALVKESPEAAAAVCTSGLNALRLLSVYLSPILPEITHQLAHFLNEPNLNLSQIDEIRENHAIHDYVHVASRLEKDQVEKLILDPF